MRLRILSAIPLAVVDHTELVIQETHKKRYYRMCLLIAINSETIAKEAAPARDVFSLLDVWKRTKTSVPFAIGGCNYFMRNRSRYLFMRHKMNVFMKSNNLY